MTNDEALEKAASFGIANHLGAQSLAYGGAGKQA